MGGGAGRIAIRETQILVATQIVPRKEQRKGKTTGTGLI